ncbi:hypothetical protein OAH13_04810, partial [Flavobacteriaceae bacterium]|nr:hypothetical protein [Flavobacteriaceae bacterium]
MQLYIQLLFFIFNPLFSQLSKTNDSIIFKFDNEKYYFGGFNEVFLIQNDSLIRVDKSIDSRVTINAYIFELNDTVIKYGGYGFWSQRNFMYYFDNSSFEWEYYRLNFKDDLEGSFSGSVNSLKNDVIFYGGKKVNPQNEVEQIPSEEVVKFDYNQRKLFKLGLLKFDVLEKKLLTTSNDISFFYDDNYLYKIEPFKNLIFKYNKSPLINDIIKSSYIKDENVFKIEKMFEKRMGNEIITLDGDFLNYPIEEFRLYDTPFNYLNILIPISILPILFLILIYKKENAVIYDGFLIHNKTKHQFESTDIELLKKVLTNKSVNLNEVYDIYKNSELSHGHNTRICNEKIDRLSIRIKSIFNLL